MKKKQKLALIILDMMNTFDFKEKHMIYPEALKAAKKIKKLKDRCHERKIPVIYVNDNFGRWKSNWRDLYSACLEESCLGRDIALMLTPHEEDYFVLKPKHSAFYSTTLELLLRDLHVDTLIITGIAGNICVLFTANDAHMREYDVIVPKDCIASNTLDDNRFALHQFKNVFGFNIPMSTSLEL